MTVKLAKNKLNFTSKQFNKCIANTGKKWSIGVGEFSQTRFKSSGYRYELFNSKQKEEISNTFKHKQDALRFIVSFEGIQRGRNEKMVVPLASDKSKDTRSSIMQFCDRKIELRINQYGIYDKKVKELKKLKNKFSDNLLLTSKDKEYFDKAARNLKLKDGNKYNYNLMLSLYQNTKKLNKEELNALERFYTLGYNYYSVGVDTPNEVYVIKKCLANLKGYEEKQSKGLKEIFKIMLDDYQPAIQPNPAVFA